MKKHIKWAGAALIFGAVLMFTRMAPIFAILPDDMAFPPITTEDMIQLATLAGGRWQLSHLMGLAAVILFGIAYAAHAKLLLNAGSKRIGSGLVVSATLAVGLFGIALVLDGFYVPSVIDNYHSVAGGQAASLDDVADSHLLALRFFTPGMFMLFVTVGLLSVVMVRRLMHVRWLGIIGLVISVLALTAYVTGAAGPNWSEMRVAGSLMMAAFLWHLILGVRILLVTKDASLPQIIDSF